MAGLQLSLLAWLVALLLLVAPAASASSSSSSSSSSTTATARTPSPTVYDPATAASATGAAQKYRYQGCIHELSSINGTAPGARALQYGTSEVLPGAMTVPACLAFCGGGSTTYMYAGLEYARECWCGTRVSVLATAAADGDCNLPCDGDNTTLCGGSLRLTLYQMPSATPIGAAPARQRAGALAVALAASAAALLHFL